jgi:hypothetical protein
MAETPKRRQPSRRNKTPDENGQVIYVRYTPTVVRRICERLAEGESWAQICSTDGMPSYGTLYVWRRRYPDFAEAVDAAREHGADLSADKALAVAAAATKETVQQDRLHVATLMKHAALTAPRRWGGKAAKAAKPEPVEVVFHVRHFEVVTGPDGRDFVREIKPEGQA